MTVRQYTVRVYSYIQRTNTIQYSKSNLHFIKLYKQSEKNHYQTYCLHVRYNMHCGTNKLRSRAVTSGGALEALPPPSTNVVPHSSVGGSSLCLNNRKTIIQI